jgi:hypothetical protein
MGKYRKCRKVCSESLLGRNVSGDQGIVAGEILKWILKKFCLRYRMDSSGSEQIIHPRVP